MPGKAIAELEDVTVTRAGRRVAYLTVSTLFDALSFPHTPLLVRTLV
jgi:hypothetical protein